MGQKVFWISFFIIGALADLILPLVWALILTIPIMVFLLVACIPLRLVRAEYIIFMSEIT